MKQIEFVVVAGKLHKQEDKPCSCMEICCKSCSLDQYGCYRPCEGYPYKEVDITKRDLVEFLHKIGYSIETRNLSYGLDEWIDCLHPNWRWSQGWEYHVKEL